MCFWHFLLPDAHITKIEGINEGGCLWKWSLWHIRRYFFNDIWTRFGFKINYLIKSCSVSSVTWIKYSKIPFKILLSWCKLSERYFDRKIILFSYLNIGYISYQDFTSYSLNVTPCLCCSQLKQQSKQQVRRSAKPVQVKFTACRWHFMIVLTKSDLSANKSGWQKQCHAWAVAYCVFGMSMCVLAHLIADARMAANACVWNCSFTPM